MTTTRQHLRTALVSSTRTFLILWAVIILPLIVAGQVQDYRDAQAQARHDAGITLTVTPDPTIVPPPGYRQTP